VKVIVPPLPACLISVGWVFRVTGCSWLNEYGSVKRIYSYISSVITDQFSQYLHSHPSAGHHRQTSLRRLNCWALLALVLILSLTFIYRLTTKRREIDDRADKLSAALSITLRRRRTFFDYCPMAKKHWLCYYKPFCSMKLPASSPGGTAIGRIFKPVHHQYNSL